MGRLIDADKLMETIRKHSYLMLSEDWSESDYAMTVTGIEQAIAEQPEAVVRCKDCIFYSSTKGYSFGVCKYFNRDEDDTDYCNSGERRTDESNLCI